MNVVVLTGGGGGAKLIAGLAAHLAPHELTAIVNTGDDFVHLGLAISPDLDSVVYTLGGVLDARGWGRANETFHALETLRTLGAETWFQLGDRDLAVHLRRTEWLARGERLTEITRRVCACFGVNHTVLPMTDAPRPTWVETPDERLPFQRWYVEHRARPTVVAVQYEGSAHATPEVCAALDAADRVVLAPSNPYLSLGPILAVPGIRERLAGRRVIAVSPLVGCDAVTGPLARMQRELGSTPGVSGLVAHYGALVTTWVVDRCDASVIAAPHVATDVLMPDGDARARLAAEVLRL